MYNTRHQASKFRCRDGLLNLSKWPHNTTAYINFITLYKYNRGNRNNSYSTIQQDEIVFQNLLFHIYVKLNMFWATHHPLSEAWNCISSLLFVYVEGCWTYGCRTLSGRAFLKQTWLFPHLYGFCNPVRIQGLKINDMK
jgi:hypothetical protein